MINGFLNTKFINQISEYLPYEESNDVHISDSKMHENADNLRTTLANSHTNFYSNQTKVHLQGRTKPLVSIDGVAVDSSDIECLEVS